MEVLSEQKKIAFEQRFKNVVRDEPMASHTNFRIGGPARLYVIATSSDELLEMARFAQEQEIPFVLYGGGSNLLVADEGYEGVVIQAGMRAIVFSGNEVMAEAGAITGLVARQSVQNGLGGFEWAVGVPGTIGGAVYGNAGCYGGEMKDNVVTVDAIRLRDLEHVTLTNAECDFGYRSSFFKKEPHLILSTTLRIEAAADAESSKARLQWVMDERKAKQPLGESSAGCAFKNWDFENESELDILKREIPEVPESMLKAKRISAGWLIDQAGMLGASLGDVAVSQKHGNFMVNKGKAKAADVIALISRVKMKVRDTFGIELEEEVQLIGF